MREAEYLIKYVRSVEFWSLKLLTGLQLIKTDADVIFPIIMFDGAEGMPKSVQQQKNKNILALKNN